MSNSEGTTADPPPSKMSAFHTECDSQLVCRMAFWIPLLLLIAIRNLHPFEGHVKHFFQELQFRHSKRGGGAVYCPGLLAEKLEAPFKEGTTAGGGSFRFLWSKGDGRNGDGFEKGFGKKKLPWLPNEVAALRHPDALRKPNGLFSQGARILSLRNFLIHRHILW
jgi:hypothetical protein